MPSSWAVAQTCKEMLAADYPSTPCNYALTNNVAASLASARTGRGVVFAVFPCSMRLAPIMAGSDRAPCLGHGISELCNGEWMWGKVTTVSKMSLKLVCFFLCALTAPDRTGKWLKYLQLICPMTKGLWETLSLTPWVQHTSVKLKPKSMMSGDPEF